ncbi:MAG: YlmC/YmxH family sporulation protein [Lachnospiraceae bacterium]
MRLCELRNIEVINLCNCKRLGCVADLMINICKGQIEAIIIPGPGRICGFIGSDLEYVIPFECIKKIGPDIILVEVCEEKVLVSCKL